jgi:hypothetical protein
MSEGNCSRLLITPPFRMSYPNLIKPRPYNNKGEPRYSLDMIFDPDMMEKFWLADDTVEKGFRQVQVKDVLVEIFKEKWPSGKMKETLHKDGWPLKSGDKLADRQEAKGKNGDAYKGKTIISAKASKDYPPTLKYKNGGKTVNLDMSTDADKKKAEALFAGGNYARAEVNAKAIDTPDCYLVFYVNNVIFFKEGEKLGRGSALDRFDGIEGGESDYDPTRDLDDEVPF